MRKHADSPKHVNQYEWLTACRDLTADLLQTVGLRPVGETGGRTVMATALRAAIYARVSTLDQEPENQLEELRRYVEARGWSATEYVDHGVSGAKDRRPALDRLRADAHRRQFDVLICWRLDRLGRNLRHLITLLDDLQALGVAFVSLAEGIDATTPAGKLQMHILGAISDYAEPGIMLSGGSDQDVDRPSRR